MRGAADQHHLVPGAREHAAVVAAHGARAHDGDVGAPGFKHEIAL
jgi:hypothetical protein